MRKYDPPANPPKFRPRPSVRTPRAGGKAPSPDSLAGWSAAAAPTTPLSSAPQTHDRAVRTARRCQTFGRAVEVRALSEDFSYVPRSSDPRMGSSGVESLLRRRLKCSSAQRLRFYNRGFHSFHNRGGE